ncbi:MULTISPECIES: peptide-methionine (R)-S-oxide reductase MsrB [unclassified Mesorhizobium]|uniref:peptide-methionine (R)-S-oxide reductase MsrB n=1 Tax=unclassified Mesorhizobium TaxID=325217 RepID=UPI000FDB4146|nr:MULTISPECIES: peptide-methionine (R)-S-oxide reductase MsrB [unclassified Mesorhizobium]TGQ38678.1 peptide-methionine (R)-S-oxide reductase [Mesorhizobium sp. M00.F.Ca.ET.216.01.1.1]TIS60091.1 MAG: peptide-methionine (R)-S-oxide reductase MsrB [Mesorhizobium sp.]TIS89508.1 MAG: peptide-methionine (R)-S-oxide reductase MsrB [Mesorhizobium sp.]TJW10456.1 MAG: peptide-methionine (R)-S-oxide reductase MsrB [Mesorhizobium sp.]TJW45554.1 MAG: peptide-methionine (R)-S-oxide reductase MsrB [Mesorhi
MNRRDFLLSGAAVATLSAGTAAMLRLGGAPDARAAETFEITKTEAEWHTILSDAAFNVLRKQGTEYPGTSPLLNEHRKGIFHCAGCDLPVYSSETKFDSGTGWPSFWQEIHNAVGKTVDRSLGMTRTEVHCRRCGGHLGHVFDDGPPPTGLRHCINGVALTFKPATA